ncbi:hypothetical protein [Rhodococcoides fascians]|uniref:hypothetical protein n=1 Tax=Rhodococcoides fascians TaxID=1828 RepID=UPI0005693EC0|nr:hypothetical protein [Rhodococcus fascians]
MSLRADLETLIDTWTAAAETASQAGRTRIATNFYNSAEALQAVLAANKVTTKRASMDDVDIEHGLYWPDGRIVPAEPSMVLQWAGNEDVMHVTRQVGMWSSAAELQLARTA